MNKETIVIIGGTGSIGYALANEIKKNNFKPYLVARNEELLKKASIELDCEYSAIDVTNTEKLKNELNNLRQNVYGLAYCTGSINLKPLKLSNEKDFIDSYKINTLGAVVAVKSLLSSLIKNKGSVLFFSSIAAQKGFKNHTITSSAKGAIEAITLSLASELAPNVRVNCIAPSITNSNMSKLILSNQIIKKSIENMHPIPKIGKSEDFSKLSSFLLSKDNSWITGQIMRIDGGRSTLNSKN